MVNFRTFPGLIFKVMDSKSLCQLLLFGGTNLTVVENRIVLEATMAYIKATKRFSYGVSTFCSGGCGESFSRVISGGLVSLEVRRSRIL